jgi:hypothetical protein
MIVTMGYGGKRLWVINGPIEGFINQYNLTGEIEDKLALEGSINQYNLTGELIQTLNLEGSLIKTTTITGEIICR